MLTVLTPIAKYLRRGTRVGSLASLDTLCVSMNHIITKTMTKGEHSQCTYADRTPIHNTDLSGALA